MRRGCAATHKPNISRLRGLAEQVEDFGRVFEAMEIVRQFDHPLGATRNERSVGKGNAIPELCFEQVPSYRVRGIAGHALRGATEQPAVSGADFDSRSRQG